MATFDQLPAEQRAIIELVVARGRSYDALADVLQVSTERVRELAREALVELSPVSARRVDGEWRTKVADYLLGQQAGREAEGTRAHLAQSEAARTWALSLLDALDTLFGDDVPEIPEAGAAAAAQPAAAAAVAEPDVAPEPKVEPEAAEEPETDRDEEGEQERARDRETDRDEDRAGEKERDREAERERAREERRERERAEARERETAEDRARERRREREREESRDRDGDRERDQARGRGPDRDDERDGERDRDSKRERDRDRERDGARGRDRDGDRDGAAAEGAALSPAARAAVRRRRILGGVGALVLLAAIVVGILALTGAFSSDNSGTSTSNSSSTPTTPTPTTSTTSTTPSTTTPQQRPQVLGQVALAPQNGAKAQGVAYILQQGTQRVLAVTAKLPPLPATQRKAAYNVWLFNSTKDAESIGAQFTTPQGDYQGVGALPANYKRFKYIDVSAQPFNRKTGHSGNSFLRGALANLKPVPKNQQPNGTTAPTGP